MIEYTINYNIHTHTYIITGENTFVIKDILKKHKFFWSKKSNNWETLSKKNIESLEEYISKNAADLICLKKDYNKTNKKYNQDKLPNNFFSFDEKVLAEANNYLVFQCGFGKEVEGNRITYFQDDAEIEFEKIGEDEYKRVH